jgi:hypothetical protein
MSPSETNTQAHITPHTHLFATTFWHVLPSHYDKIRDRYIKIANLYYEASSAVMVTDRAAGGNLLNGEIDMLEHDIAEYRAVVNDIGIEDVIGIYMTGGRQRWRAEQIAKQDFGDMESSLREIEEKVRSVKADVVYEFEERE